MTRRVLPPLAIGLLSRLLLFVVVTLGLIYGEPVRQGAGWRAFPDNPIIDGWVRWDAGWYASIAREGYINPEEIVEGRARNTVFFPLYPLAMRALTPLLGDVYLAGLAVSNVGFLVALVLLYLLVLEKLGRDTAVRATILLAFNPYALFFSAVYTESLFLALVLGSFYCAERERWVSASALASLAALTRVNGFITSIALVVMFLRKHRDRLALPPFGILLLGFAGPVAHLSYLWQRYGSPFEFVHAQLAASWATTAHLWPTSSTEFRHWVFLLAALGLALWAGFRIGSEYGLWGVATSLTSLTHWTSGGRHALVIFPATIMLARLLQNRYLFASVLIYYLYYLVVLALRFSHWRWVG